MSLCNLTVIGVVCAILIAVFLKLWKWLTSGVDIVDRIAIGAAYGLIRKLDLTISTVIWIMYSWNWISHAAYGLIRKLDLTIVCTRMKSRSRILSDFFQEYRNMGYVLMELDKPRSQAYEEAAKQVFLSSCPKQGSNAVTWLDIGTGPRMFLSQMLLKNPTTKHVHAVEANTNSYEQATLLQQATPILKEKIPLHQRFSSSIEWGKCDPAPTAIIHDVLGTI
ncbi:unnamed protein product, partial [Rotaria magnacalcarata]